jgi:hypothetical protein
LIDLYEAVGADAWDVGLRDGVSLGLQHHRFAVGMQEIFFQATSISFVTEGAESRQDVLVVMVLRTGCGDERLERLCPSLRNFECRSRRHRGLGVMLRLDCVLRPRLLSVHRGIRNARLRHASIFEGGSFLTLGCGGAVSVLKQFRQGFLDGADSPGETKTFGKS